MLNSAAPLATAEENAILESASLPFVGRWNGLVSDTNWEKGRIIREWRAALIAAAAPPPEFSDEAWSARVGGVTGQHVGRLRRVSERFGETHSQYAGLYWSHFQSSLDWPDAEMWLEGAVQNGWSVSAMRQQRWETLQPPGEAAPLATDVITAETDEDCVPEMEREIRPQIGESDSVAGPLHEGPDFGDEPQGGESGANIYADEGPEKPAPFVQPFANLGQLPDDLCEAFENFKLAILRHKTDDWRQISREEVLAALDALKELALAPSAEKSPF